MTDPTPRERLEKPTLTYPFAEAPAPGSKDEEETA